MRKLINVLMSIYTVAGTIGIGIGYIVAYILGEGITTCNNALFIFAIMQIGFSLVGHNGLIRALCIWKLNGYYGTDLNNVKVRYSDYWVEKCISNSIIKIAIFSAALMLINSPVFTSSESVAIMALGYAFKAYYAKYCFDKYTDENNTVLIKSRTTC